MNNDKQSKKKKSNFIKENGFLVALYSIVGVLVVVAVSLTFFMPTSPKDETLVSLEDSFNVSNNLAKSYKTQVDTTEKSEIGEAQTEEKNDDTKKTEKQNNLSQSIDTKTNENITKTEESTTKESDSAKSTDSNQVIFEDEQTLNTAQPSTTIHATKVKGDSNESANADELQMQWPVTGEVVLDYSPQTLVYDKTLEQYRTTNSIDIASEKGQDVFAAYDGTVKLVSKSVDQGNYVVIDHGNGWVTTYSQLDDSMKVSVGDDIKKGQQIGSVAEPTTGSILLGTHLDFKVTKNDQTVNPMDVLE